MIDKDKYFKFTPKECIFTWTELCNTETKEKEKKSSETKEKRAQHVVGAKNIILDDYQ